MEPHDASPTMPPHARSSTLSPGLRDRVLERFGFTRPPALDLDGLTALYSAWCAHVPFDNVRKMIAILTGGHATLPGSDAADFFEHWLAHGAGATCWPSSNALVDLACAVGFDARRLVASMGDRGVVNHGSAAVVIDDDEWLIDSSILSNAPLPLHRGVVVGNDVVFAAEVEPAGDTHVIWWSLPSRPDYLPCRLHTTPVDHAYYVDAYEASRAGSIFNRRLVARRNFPGRMLVLDGDVCYTRTAAGDTAERLSPDDLAGALRHVIGLSGDLVTAWRRAGGVQSILDAPKAARSDDPPRLPPSARGHVATAGVTASPRRLS